MRNQVRMSSIVLLLTLLTGCSPVAENQMSGSIETLRVGYGKVSDGPSVEWGTSQGVFEKFGIEIQGTPIDGTEALAALTSGQLDVVAMSLSDILLAQQNGNFEGVFVASSTGYTREQLERAKQEPLYPGELLLQVAVFVPEYSEIQSWPDLANKKIGVEVATDVAALGFQLALKSESVNPDSVQFVLVPRESRQDSLVRGDIDAAILTGTLATKAVLDGFRLIGYPGAYFYAEGPAKIWITTPRALEQNPQLLANFRKAILEINKELQDIESNGDSFRKILVEKFGLTQQVADSTTLPNFWTQDLTQNHVEDLSRNMIESGILNSLGKLPQVLK